MKNPKAAEHTVGKDKMLLIKAEDMAAIMCYAWRMAQTVVPKTIFEYTNVYHGTQDCNFFGDLYMVARNGDMVNFENDEFYSAVLQKYRHAMR